MFVPPNVMKRCLRGRVVTFTVSLLRKVLPASNSPRATFPIVILSSRRVVNELRDPLTKQPMTAQALVLGQREQIHQISRS